MAPKITWIRHDHFFNKKTGWSFGMGLLFLLMKRKRDWYNQEKTPSGNGVDGIAQVFTMESVFKSTSKWKFSQILWKASQTYCVGQIILSDSHGNIFVGSFHVLMERYLTTDSVIVVLVLFNIDTLEVSIGVSTPSIPFMWNWLFALDEALQDLYYSLSTESADRFLKIVNRKMLLFRYKEFFLHGWRKNISPEIFCS